MEKRKVWWQKDRQVMQEKLDAYEDFVKELRDYLSSNKFAWPENQVNVNDIFARIFNLGTKISDIEWEVK